MSSRFWTWACSGCKKMRCFSCFLFSCKQDYLLNIRLFTKICTLLYIWVLKRIRWLRLLQENFLLFVSFFYIYIHLSHSFKRYDLALYLNVSPFTSCIFFLNSSSHFGYCKTVINFISQFYFIKTQFWVLIEGFETCCLTLLFNKPSPELVCALRIFRWQCRITLLECHSKTNFATSLCGAWFASASFSACIKAQLGL